MGWYEKPLGCSSNDWTGTDGDWSTLASFGLGYQYDALRRKTGFEFGNPSGSLLTGQYGFKQTATGDATALVDGFSAHCPNGKTVSFTYGSDGIRTSKTVDGYTHQYILEDGLIRAETIEDGPSILCFFVISLSGCSCLPKSQFTHWYYELPNHYIVREWGFCSIACGKRAGGGIVDTISNTVEAFWYDDSWICLRCADEKGHIYEDIGVSEYYVIAINGGEIEKPQAPLHSKAWASRLIQKYGLRFFLDRRPFRYYNTGIPEAMNWRNCLT